MMHFYLTVILTSILCTIGAGALALPDGSQSRVLTNSCGVMTVQLLRMWDSVAQDHFYTTDVQEMLTALQVSGRVYEGVAANIVPTQAPGTFPLYRLVHAPMVDHFYTTDAAEKDVAINSIGYTDEGIAGYVYLGGLCDTTIFYRMFKAAPTFDHFYTSDLAERDRFVTQKGYLSEGIAGFVN